MRAMRQRRAGTLVGIASVAGIRGLPGHGAYCSSKSAVISYCESLRGELRPDGVRVVTLLPGYIDTPLTRENRYSMPFLMTADDFADQAFAVLTVVLPFVQAGTVNLLGVTSAARYGDLPNVPAIGEVVKDYDYSSEMGILAPSGTPAPVINKLSQALREALNSAEVQKQFKLGSIVPLYTTPAGYTDNLRRNLRKYEQAVNIAKPEPTN